jgi:hypothetical protein
MINGVWLYLQPDMSTVCSEPIDSTLGDSKPGK